VYSIPSEPSYESRQQIRKYPYAVGRLGTNPEAQQSYEQPYDNQIVFASAIVLASAIACLKVHLYEIFNL
jgi:hypothetical protein